jgi:hypothetical protein
MDKIFHKVAEQTAGEEFRQWRQNTYLDDSKVFDHHIAGILNDLVDRAHENEEELARSFEDALCRNWHITFPLPKCFAGQGASNHIAKSIGTTAHDQMFALQTLFFSLAVHDFF